jgi:adenylate cyclase
MNPFAAVSASVRRVVARSSAWVAKRWKHVFYLYLAAAFSLFVAIDAAFFRVTANIRQRAFDMVVRYRLVIPEPDPDIVIVDIDEASLAAMAKEYGRWPWPRQVLGEFLEHLEGQHPKAVVFDILFSDPDVYNPDSDAYFDAAVAETANTFFPMLRLDEASDGLSQIAPAMIPGATPISREAPQQATIAVVLPHVPSILRGGRLGLHNIYPDPDGVVREYLVYRNDYGWAIPSLPARVARELGYPVPTSPRVLLNWRGKPFSYRTVGFSDVFDDMLSKHKRRPPNEFTDKIVLIGSTAPSLFDVKPTPMSRLHPGVEILATAIDNLKRGDYLRYPEGRILTPLLSALIVWGTAWAFYREAGRGKIDRLFGASQFILLGVSFASINLTTTYINLTGPVTVGLAYFTLARVYAAATTGLLEASAVRNSEARSGALHAALLLIRVADSADGEGARSLDAVRHRVARLGTEPKSVDKLAGRQKGIWALFENTLAVSWVIPAHDAAARERLAKDIRTITACLEALCPKRPAGGEPSPTWVLQEGPIAGGSDARAGWRVLFAEAQTRWHEAAGAREEITP